MTSAAKIEANRRNARKSTGPRTPAGKARTRRNAYKHGLTIPANYGEETLDELNWLFDHLKGPFPRPDHINEVAVRAAEAQLEVRRVRQAKATLVNHAPLRHAQAQELDRVERTAARFAAKCDLLPAFDRYERRALGKRDRALRELRRFEEERERRYNIEPVGPPRKRPVLASGPFVETAFTIDCHRTIANMLASAPPARLRPPGPQPIYWQFRQDLKYGSYPVIGTIEVRMTDNVGRMILRLQVDGTNVEQRWVVRRRRLCTGGFLYEVKCPETGRWVRHLYLLVGHHHYRSRHALGLHYESQSGALSDRMFLRIDKLMTRLGDNVTDIRNIPPRPKNMRGVTYWMLCDDINESYRKAIMSVVDAGNRREKRERDRQQAEQKKWSQKRYVSISRNLLLDRHNVVLYWKRGHPKTPHQRPFSRLGFLTPERKRKPPW